MSKKKNIFNFIILVTVFLITIYCVFKGQDINEIKAYMKNVDVRYLFAGVICVVCFICSESVIIFYLLKKINILVRLRHCFLYSFVGFFFSCITPSASGGQPAQIYFMRKDKIPMSISALILMIVTITYKMVLVVIGAAVLIIRHRRIMIYLNPIIGWCYLGLILNVICVGILLMLVYNSKAIRTVCINVLEFINKIIKIKRKDYYIEKIESSMKQYEDVAVFIQGQTIVLFKVFLMTLFQRTLLFFITYLVFRSFGFKSVSAVKIVTLQAMIVVAVDMLPLPGGMGISEKLFFMVFRPICGRKLILPVMIASRGLSYYTELILSAVMTVAANFIIVDKEDFNDKISM